MKFNETFSDCLDRKGRTIKGGRILQPDLINELDMAADVKKMMNTWNAKQTRHPEATTSQNCSNMISLPHPKATSHNCSNVTNLSYPEAKTSLNFSNVMNLPHPKATSQNCSNVINLSHPEAKTSLQQIQLNLQGSLPSIYMRI